MFLVLSCSTFYKDREKCLNILENLDINKCIILLNQNQELLPFISLMSCIRGTSFEKISFTEWKHKLLIVV